MTLVARLVRLVLAISLCAEGPALAQAGPSVAAASDLQFALDDIAREFQALGNSAPRLTYGSSGNFRRQIAQGAPFEVFLSADEGFVFELKREGHAVDDGALYAIGRIVLFAPPGSPLDPSKGLAEAAALARAGAISKFAIANPEHAPYGRAAEQALRKSGAWPALEPKLVLGENVSQAAQFTASGSAQGGILAYSLALAPAFSSAGRYALIPADLHAPLRQRMALTRKATPAARAFYEFLQSPAARAVFRRYGFLLPGEEAK